MSTTLPLFWHLSAASKKERLDASAKLVSALEHFQASFVPKNKDASASETSEDEDEDEDGDVNSKSSDGLDALNAQDVSYSIRRLIRGLASPRESSRLGFAVALTELLARINSVTCSQIVQLILDSSKTQGSMNGQEERDVLFARLFGLTSVIQSGLLLRDSTLPSSSTTAADLSSYREVLSQLLELGEKKSWLRESAWWSILLAVDALSASDVSWKEDALEATVSAVYSDSKMWTPEKVALTLKLQSSYPSKEWKKHLSPPFKNPDLLSTGNLSTVARILKESDADEDKETDLPKSGSWKPQVHFVWDMLLDQVLPETTAPAPGHRAPKGSFPEFFRIVVDESLFASTSSPERKFWGFQVFQKALPRVRADDMPMLFTKNFMRSWINHLSNSDRYLHKAARAVAADIQSVVNNEPQMGFSLILQLTGVNGSRQFDKLTKTKTVESILTSMDEDGIRSYLEYLLKQVDEERLASADAASESDIQALNTRRAWIIDQLSALVRNGAVPKSDGWIQTILDWLAVHGLFVIVAKKKTEKGAAVAGGALRSAPTPAFSEELRRNCRERLLACLADLTAQTTVIKDESKATKVAAVASDGRFWVSRVLATIAALEKDPNHVRPLDETEEEEQEQREKVHELIARLKDTPDERREEARGVELLLAATLLHNYCAEDEDADADSLEDCLEGALRLFPAEPPKKGKGKKSRKSMGEDAGEARDTDKEDPEPADVLVDAVIGFLEKGTAYMRAVANQVFALLSGAVRESTIDLILTQLERRDPQELMADDDEDEDVEMGDAEVDEEDGGDSSASSASSDEEPEEDGDEGDEEVDLELRRKIEEALRVNGISAATGESDDESEEDLMDDDQMLAIDEQLSAAFKARAAEKRHGKDTDAQREATHFKNRVLDLLDVFVKRQPTSPLVLRLVLPLVELIVGTGPDEKQLADKATGILRNRLGKSKEVPSPIPTADVAKTLESLHGLARKAASPDVLATLAQCSLYLSKALLHAGAPEPVLDAYRASLRDFVARKASRLNTAFFDDFVKRHPLAAWEMRGDLVQACGEALNVYRQAQSFHLFQTLVNQLPALGDRKAEIVAFMPTLRKAILNTVSPACEGESALQPSHVKEMLKLALVAVRQTKRVCSNGKELSSAWEPTQWSELSGKLSKSERFRASVGLQAMCKQIVQLLQVAKADAKAAGQSKKEKGKAGAKRKAEDTVDDVDDGATTESSKKAKHKKARKAHSS